MHSWSLNTLWVQATQSSSVQHTDGPLPPRHGNRMPVSSPSNHQAPLLIPLCLRRVNFPNIGGDLTSSSSLREDLCRQNHYQYQTWRNDFSALISKALPSILI